MSTLDELESAVNAVRRCDWRITQEETGEWIAWFDPDWQALDVRVFLTLDGEPSPNEVAAVAALQMVMAHAPALVEVACAAAEWRATWSMRGDHVGAVERRRAARERLFAALDRLEPAP